MDEQGAGVQALTPAQCTGEVASSQAVAWVLLGRRARMVGKRGTREW